MYCYFFSMSIQLFTHILNGIKVNYYVIHLEIFFFVGNKTELPCETHKELISLDKHSC